MENIMNYKLYLYIIFVFLSVFAFSGINFEKIIKKNKAIEARLLIIIFSFISGYLLTNFVVDFIECSKIL